MAHLSATQFREMLTNIDVPEGTQDLLEKLKDSPMFMLVPAFSSSQGKAFVGKLEGDTFFFPEEIFESLEAQLPEPNGTFGAFCGFGVLPIIVVWLDSEFTRIEREAAQEEPNERIHSEETDAADAADAEMAADAARADEMGEEFAEEMRFLI